MRISDWSSDVCSSDLLAGRTLVRHLSFNAFWDELQVVPHLLLEVAVSRAAGPRTERAHAPVRLVGPALVQVNLAGALVGAGQQRAHPGPVCAGDARLGAVGGVLVATGSDAGHPGPPAYPPGAAYGRETRT